MTTAAVVLLAVAGLSGTLAWLRRLPVHARTALVLVAVLLLAGAFLLAAAQADDPVVRGPAPTAVLTSVPRALAWLLVGWLAAAGGGPLTELVLRTASRRPFLQAPGRSADAAVDDAVAGPDAAAQELRGGAMIGLLEPAAVAGAVLAGASSGIALVVAVKALGRYPELRTAGASDRFIIGTLASLLWATAVAGTGVLLLR